MTDSPDDSDEVVDDPFVELDIDDDGSDPFAELVDDPARDDAATPAASEEKSTGTGDDIDGIEPEDVSQVEDGGDPFTALDNANVDVGDDPVGEIERAAAAGSGNVFENRSVDDPEAVPEPTEKSPLAEMAGEGTVIVPKSRYCQSCEFFDAPPNVQCTHPEAEILELVGMDRFKVRNCPVVKRRTSTGMVSEGDIEYVDEPDQGQDQEHEAD